MQRGVQVHVGSKCSVLVCMGCVGSWQHATDRGMAVWGGQGVTVWWGEGGSQALTKRMDLLRFRGFVSFRRFTSY